MDSTQKIISTCVMKNQIIVIIKQDDTLVNIFKNTGFQTIQHSVSRVIKTAPVQQKGSKTVATDRIVNNTVNVFIWPEQKYSIYGDNGQNPKNDIKVLCPVFPRNSE